MAVDYRRRAHVGRVLRDGRWGYCARYERDGDTLTHHMIIGKSTARATRGAAAAG
jgi:hypothetical protein